MAGGHVGHLWVEAVSEVELCEICRELRKQQKKKKKEWVYNLNWELQDTYNYDAVPYYKALSTRKDIQPQIQNYSISF